MPPNWRWCALCGQARPARCAGGQWRPAMCMCVSENADAANWRPPAQPSVGTPVVTAGTRLAAGGGCKRRQRHRGRFTTRDHSLIISRPNAVPPVGASSATGCRAQVFVESLIAEVASTKAAEFGIQWQGARKCRDMYWAAGNNLVQWKHINLATGVSGAVSLHAGSI